MTTFTGLDWMQMLQPCTSISMRLLPTKSPGLHDTYMIGLIMKLPRGFKAANPGLVIGEWLVILSPSFKQSDV